MARYIDADALIEALRTHFNDNDDPNDEVRIYKNAYWHHRVVTNIINLTPSIDIVRCKECGHHLYDEPNDCKMCRIHEYGEIWEDDDFCSYGEREYDD